MQTLDLVAKLLANEDINVVRAAAQTASFDAANRTLVLPQWKEMTPNIDQLFVAHEVGHALYTTNDYYDALDTRLKFRGAKMFLNILEDARIEKLIKRRYPGIRKVFNAGYRELNDLDFFNIRSRDLASAHLLDRINLYFKVGYGIVSFSTEEKPLVARAEQLESTEDVIQLAQDIYDFLKQEEERKAEEAAANPPEEEEEEEYEEDIDSDIENDADYMDDLDTEHSFNDLDSPAYDEPGSEGQEDMYDEPPPESEADANNEPETNTAFEARVSELADINQEYKYWTLESFPYNPIIPYKVVAEEVSTYFGHEALSSSYQQDIRTFKRDTQNNVDYMVKEFEMRKAATAYKRQQTAKVGSLDMKKVWAYKINDDLFKRVTTVKQGKNHGMIFLLDWSGSMTNVIRDTIDQVINLSMFCQRAGIAYQVFAFTDANSSNDYTEWRKSKDTRTDPDDEYREIPPAEGNVIRMYTRGFGLLELFSSKMSVSEFNTAINNLKSNRLMHRYRLSGTPLNESLAFMYDYIGEFQRKNNVEKVSFITLTDGAGSALYDFPQVSYEQVDGLPYRRVNQRHFLRDVYTKKSREITNDSYIQTNILIEMIKERYECKTLGFFVTPTNRRSLFDAQRAHYGEISFSKVDDIKDEFRTKGYASLMNTGRDELFLIPLANTRVQYETLKVDANANARSIATKFGKYMSTKKTSRILLNKFIGHVA
jgi:hypothetical protein